MAAFKVLETQFQMFIKSRIYLDDEYVIMTHKYFLEYTQIEIREFHDTLIQHMESVKKSIDKRALHKREYDSRVNERQMQTTEEKVDTSKALDASLVYTESSGIESGKYDTSSSSGNDVDADDADIKPVYDEEPMVEEKGFAIAALKNELRKLKGNNVNTKFAKSSILGKPILHPLRNQSVVRQPTTFKSEQPRISKPRFASQVDVNNDLSKPVTTHYLPKGKESAYAKPHHMIAPSSSRWVPTGKIFTYSTTKVDSEPTNGSNEDITNQYECEQTLDVSAGSLNLSAAMTSDHNSSELGIHYHSNEPSSSKLVPKFVPPADKRATSQQELELLFSPMYEEYFNVGNPSVSKSSALSDNSTQHDTQPTLNAPPTSELINPPTNVNAEENMYKRRCCSLIPGESNSIPHAHAQTTKTYYKHQDSSIKKDQVLKTKTSTNSNIKDPSSETKLQGRLLASFQDDAKYEHVGQDTRSQDGKDDKDKQGKDLKISESKTKSKDNEKGSR
ncbi:hypothetical protein Tco_0088238 [Tanacetum coccineum]